ncbi:MAG: hypothetical protein OEZ36_06380 [Spirochaetota bacterium]|nr:hypothetical protein [Spirochaetota bacterium]
MSDLFEKLPLCRKEKYYTSCVLPQIICGDDFSRLGVFLEKLDVPEEFIRDSYTPEDLLFYTEYSLKDSAEGKKEKEEGNSSKIPDLVLLIQDNNKNKLFLLVIEAKMFLKTRASGFRQKLDDQKEIIDSIKKSNSIKSHFLHLGILLESVDVELVNNERVILWDDILEWYMGALQNNYFYQILAIAVESKDEKIGGSTAEYLPPSDKAKETELYKNLISHIDRSKLIEGGNATEIGRLTIYSGGSNLFCVRINASKSKSINILDWRKINRDPMIPTLKKIKTYIGECEGYNDYKSFLQKHFPSFDNKSEKTESVKRSTIEKPEVMAEWVDIMLKLSNA